MGGKSLDYLWREKRFLFRLLASYLLVLVPFAPSLVLLLTRSVPDPFFILIYQVFGLAAMVALGTPLLFCYIQFGWTGFVPFMVGAGLCAGITSFGFLGPSRNLPQVGLFIVLGSIAGSLYRTILFGTEQPASIPLNTIQFKQELLPFAMIPKLFLIVFGGLVSSAFLLLIYSVSDEHQTVTEQMGWECVDVQDIDRVQFAHVEHVRFWFLKNSHYSAIVAGPHLCADLQQIGIIPVTITFDVWGNRIHGLHGYNEISIAAGSKTLKTYGIGSGGFHLDVSYSGNQNPVVERFPLEVFK